MSRCPDLLFSTESGSSSWSSTKSEPCKMTRTTSKCLHLWASAESARRDYLTSSGTRGFQRAGHFGGSGCLWVPKSRVLRSGPC